MYGAWEVLETRVLCSAECGGSLSDHSMASDAALSDEPADLLLEEASRYWTQRDSIAVLGVVACAAFAPALVAEIAIIYLAGHAAEANAKSFVRYAENSAVQWPDTAEGWQSWHQVGTRAQAVFAHLTDDAWFVLVFNAINAMRKEGHWGPFWAASLTGLDRFERIVLASTLMVWDYYATTALNAIVATSASWEHEDWALVEHMRNDTVAYVRPGRVSLLTVAALQ